MLRLPKYPKFGRGDQESRVRAIAHAAGVNLKSFSARSCVVTGSNGKGSTAAMLASILATGARTGRFTSPHLFTINERFWLDGRDISDAALDRHWTRIESAADDWLRRHPLHTLGGFEFLFLLAASWFAEEQCDWIVWEAGIGGRRDVTRLVEPKFAAIASLDLEHTKLLGDTLEEIAFDKADICPHDALLLLGETVAPFRAAIELRLAARNVTCQTIPAAMFCHTPPLAGAHQRANAALAVALAQAMAAPDAAAIARGLAAARWPGRLEQISDDPPIVIDVGHTPAAIAAALEGFRALPFSANALLVCGASADKDARGIVQMLAPHFARIVATSAHHKGLPADEIAALARDANPLADVVAAFSIREAHAKALSLARSDAVYVAGGLFLAAEFKAAHQGLDPTSLAFF
jgi:dihydrofolate synthase/folylpolyglutamate synthase